jgi:hypothetical protein
MPFGKAAQQHQPLSPTITTTQVHMAVSVAIPQDIIDHVIAAVGDDKPLLKQCALVSSSFLLPGNKGVVRHFLHLLSFSLIRDKEGPTEPIFLPFMCRLRFLEIDINPFSATMSDFAVLSFLMRSLSISCHTRTSQVQYYI